MTENMRSVGIGELITSDAPNDVLVAYGLGSCVAICLYDPAVKVGGMLHALLPANPKNNSSGGNPLKFVDQGLPLLLKSLSKLGGIRTRLIAQLCGGAQALSALGFENDDLASIGKRNILAAQTALKAAGIPVRAQAIGGRIGRTVRLYIVDGEVTVRSLGQDVQVFTLVPDTKPQAQNMATQHRSGGALWPK
ncbi:MAG: chemotaxis protein CheD [Chloroflexi bacterium]|nr:chemotaxis protein CheD [Chloroflexota bacterium]